MSDIVRCDQCGRDCDRVRHFHLTSVELVERIDVAPVSEDFCSAACLQTWLDAEFPPHTHTADARAAIDAARRSHSIPNFGMDVAEFDRQRKATR